MPEPTNAFCVCVLQGDSECGVVVSQVYGPYSTRAIAHGFLDAIAHDFVASNALGKAHITICSAVDEDTWVDALAEWFGDLSELADHVDAVVAHYDEDDGPTPIAGLSVTPMRSTV